MDLQLDIDDWDLTFPAGSTDLTLVSGVDAIRQHLSQRLKTFMGEWFLDTRIGVPYFQQVLVKNPDPVVLDSVFKAVIVNTPGILELTDFALQVDRSTRQLKLTFTAATTEGELCFDEVLP